MTCFRFSLGASQPLWRLFRLAQPTGWVSVTYTWCLELHFNALDAPSLLVVVRVDEGVSTSCKIHLLFQFWMMCRTNTGLEWRHGTQGRLKEGNSSTGNWTACQQQALLFGGSCHFSVMRFIHCIALRERPGNGAIWFVTTHCVLYRHFRSTKYQICPALGLSRAQL